MIVKQFSFSILICDIKNIMHHISKYTIVFFYFDDIIRKNDELIKTTNQFEIEIHLMNLFKTNFFFDNDVLIAQRIKLNMKNQTIQLSNCQNLLIFINTITRKNSCFKRVVRNKNKIIIFVDVIINVFVDYYDNLSNDRDFLFESQCRKYFDDDDEIFAHIVDANLK